MHYHSTHPTLERGIARNPACRTGGKNNFEEKELITNPIALAILSGFSILIFRIILSHRPFRLSGTWKQIIVSTLAGAALWVMLALMTVSPAQRFSIEINDLICGVLILLCAFWCNYWISNLAGGFRAQMAFNLVRQSQPISLAEWMAEFGGLGMEAFLADRTKSILIPWRIASLQDDKMSLLPGWGVFLGRLMNILEMLLYRLRALP